MDRSSDRISAQMFECELRGGLQVAISVLISSDILHDVPTSWSGSTEKQNGIQWNRRRQFVRESSFILVVNSYDRKLSIINGNRNFGSNLILDSPRLRQPVPIAQPLYFNISAPDPNPAPDPAPHPAEDPAPEPAPDSDPDPAPEPSGAGSGFGSGAGSGFGSGAGSRGDSGLRLRSRLQRRLRSRLRLRLRSRAGSGSGSGSGTGAEVLNFSARIARSKVLSKSQCMVHASWYTTC